MRRRSLSSAPLSPMESAIMDSPSAECVDRFPLDRQLRRLGYRIFSRPKNGPALWVIAGTQEPAFAFDELLQVEGLASPLDDEFDAGYPEETDAEFIEEEAE